MGTGLCVSCHLVTIYIWVSRITNCFRKRESGKRSLPLPKTAVVDIYLQHVDID